MKGGHGGGARGRARKMEAGKKKGHKPLDADREAWRGACGVVTCLLSDANRTVDELVVWAARAREELGRRLSAQILFRSFLLFFYLI